MTRNSKPTDQSTPPEMIRLRAVQLFVDFYNNGASPDAKFQQLFKGADGAFCRRLVHSFMKYASDGLAVIRRINHDNNPKIHYGTACLLAVLVEYVIMKTPKHAAQSQYTMVLQRCDNVRVSSFVNHVQLVFQNEEIKPVYAPLEVQLKEFYSVKNMQIMVAAHRQEPVYFFQYTNGRVKKIARGVQITKDEDFVKGHCWVQDVAAALPVQLLGDVKGKEILDLCAAPGGKTMQLVARGADVDALEMNPKRAEMIKANLERCRMKANVIIGNFFAIQPTKIYSAVLCDAPCTASGTARKNPDILHKNYELQQYQTTQLNMLSHARQFIGVGGIIIYCVCSVFPAETTAVVEQFLAQNPNYSLQPIKFHQETEYTPENILADRPGYYQTIPNDADGFFMVKLLKNA